MVPGLRIEPLQLMLVVTERTRATFTFCSLNSVSYNFYNLFHSQKFLKRFMTFVVFVHLKLIITNKVTPVSCWKMCNHL